MMHAFFAGCDISSRRFDLCILTEDGTHLARFDNDGSGQESVVQVLRAAGVRFVVIEAPDGYVAGCLAACRRACGARMTMCSSVRA